MKYLTSALVAVALVLTSSFAVAGEAAPKAPIVVETPKTYDFSAKFYGTGVITDVDSFDDAEYGAGLAVELPLFQAVKLEVGASWIDASSTDWLDDVTVTASLVAYLPVAEKLDLFVLAGAGYELGGNELWSGHAGAGVQYSLTPQFNVFLDARYHLDEQENDFISARAGVGFKF